MQLIMMVEFSSNIVSFTSSNGEPKNLKYTFGKYVLPTTRHNCNEPLFILISNRCYFLWEGNPLAMYKFLHHYAFPKTLNAKSMINLLDSKYRTKVSKLLHPHA